MIFTLHSIPPEVEISKLLRVMKLTAILLFAACITASANGYSQKVTISEKNVPLEKVFKQIKKQTGYVFFYDEAWMKQARKVTVNVVDSPLEEVLKICFKNQLLTFSIVGTTVVLTQSIAAIPSKVNEEVRIPAPPPFTVTGKITDTDGNPLEGVSVLLKSTNRGVTTKKDGTFTIQVPDGGDVLVISYVGFENVQLTVRKSSVQDITMRQKETKGDEIVVIGYGTQRKKDLTGSVGSVTMTDLNKAPVKSFDDALAGRVAGVQITSPDGQPGASPNITIRGGNSVTQDNSPLYVIDGFPIENYNNNAINPADIESIEVLKDASSTAIYGARGANGVIMITTKKGKTGPPVITYNTYYGWQDNTKTLELMGPYDFVKLQFDIDSVRAKSSYFINGKNLESYRNVPSLDWQKQVFRTAPMQSHNLSLRGGNKYTKYSVSGSILQQDGTVIASDFKRYQGRVTLDQNVSTKLKVGVNVNYSSIITNGLQVGGGSNTATNYLINVWQYRPVNGSGNIDSLLDAAQDADVVSTTNYQWNPVLSAHNELRKRSSKLLTVNSYLDYSITPALKLRISAGVNTSNLRNDVFNTSQSRLGSPISTLGRGGPNGSSTFSELNNYVNENTLTYNKVFNKAHTLNIVGGFTTQANTASFYGAGAILVPNEELGVAGLSQGTPVSINSTESKNTLASFLGRVNYSYKSKYLATLAFRTDGSSKFVEDNKWGYFPSGALAWHFSEENFMKRLKFISDAKLRASYGIIGNNRVTDFASFGLITTGGLSSYTIGNQFVSGAYASTLSNPNLKWESTAETDLGLDLGFFNQRLILGTDVYSKKTTNLLLNAQLPSSTGYTTAFQNIGTVQNRGLELSLTSTNVSSKQFTWTSSFNIAFNRTKVLALAQNQQFLLSSVRFNSGVALFPNYIAQIGQPVAKFFGYTWVGNYQYEDFDQLTPGVYTLKAAVPNNGNPRTSIRPGDIKYRDINGDGVVDDNDRGTIGDPNPKFTGGFSNNFTYRNFDLNVFFQFVSGNEILNINRMYLQGSIINAFGSNQYASYTNRWTPTNPTNENYRPSGSGPAVNSDRIIEDGSFLRLKTINLGYNISAKMLTKVKIQSLRFYASAQNLITWTRYSGIDPEVSNYNSALTPGLDYSAYPRAKTITLGLDVSF
jgi:TonB-linked SusC/RagA family outer membrane protein